MKKYFEKIKQDKTNNSYVAVTLFTKTSQWFIATCGSKFKEKSLKANLQKKKTTMKKEDEEEEQQKTCWRKFEELSSRLNGFWGSSPRTR